MEASGTKVTYVSTTLGDEAADARFEAAAEAVRGEPPRLASIVDGQRREGAAHLPIHAPGDLDLELATLSPASSDDVDAAVSTAHRAQPAWATRPYAERVAIVRRAAELVREHVDELGAIVALEVGKNRVESIGEVQELADLFDEYCRQVEAHQDFVIQLADGPGGERNQSVLRPYGVFAVISPFNFPVALSGGPIAAALLAGNTVVFKPSPTTSRSGARVVELLYDAGVPHGALAMLLGEPAGPALAAHPAVDGIVFTGSYEVGRSIAEQYAGGLYQRPAITEMGGKNPAIVTAQADLEKAAQGIARSAFGASGQKCSACSRVLVEDSVHDELVDLLAAEARRWKVAEPSAADCMLGPVHTEEAQQRFHQAVEAAQRDGRVVVGGGDATEGLPRGYYVEPTVVADLPDGHAILSDELFVPLVAVQRVASLDSAIAAANATPYGLTAGIFSRDQAEIDAFLDRIEAGVVYVNRSAGATTGAWPGVQSFPGWKGSGSTGKGGLGPYYVLQFLREQSRTVVS
jgi:1-pyrroline-5-carboxylate dehydrogenase